MLRTKKNFWRGIGLFASTTALLAAGMTGAFSAPGGIPGPPGGGEEDEGGKNLSVPAVFVGANPFSLTCDGSAKGATYSTSTDPAYLALKALYPGYYLQGYDYWQGACTEGIVANTLVADAVWGDNLSGAPLKVNTPVRLEVGLLASGVTMNGFEVVKLDPNALDRVAPYGTLGVSEPFTEVRIWNDGATYQITDSSGTVVASGEMPAEVNSTGRVVFGAQWTTQTAGTYTLTFTAPGVYIDETGNNSESVSLIVGSSAGGGGRKGGGGGGGGQGGPRG